MDEMARLKWITVKVGYLVLLLVVMAAPQLAAERPGPIFAQIKSLVNNTPLQTWLKVGGAAMLILLAISAVRVLGSRSSRPSEMHPIQRLPIQKAVSPAHNGNGLVSDAFPLKLAWLGIAGWVEVQTPGMECLTVDGRSVIGKTKLYFSPIRLLGKPSNARRTLLAPEPRVIPTVEALSADQWSTRIDASITFRVADPLRVLSEKPLDDLNHLAQGVIGEHIRNHKQEELLSDTGGLRRALEARLRASPVLQGLEIVEVPIAVHGDERVIETRRLEEIQRAMHDLTEQKGANQLTEAEYGIRIKKMEADLEEWMRDQEHGRQMELMDAQLKAQTFNEIIGAIAAIASAGMDPAKAIREIRQLISEEGTRNVGEPEPPQLSVEDPIDIERQSMNEKAAELGFTEVAIEPSPSQPELPGKARVVFPDYVLLVEFPEQDPRAMPSVQVETLAGERSELIVPWYSGMGLVGVVGSASMQAELMLEGRGEEEE